MASPPAEGAPDPAQAKEEETKKGGGGGVLGRLWRGLFGGREDYEKRLQYLSKEEASVHARMRRRTQLSRRAVRNIIVLSVLAEVAAPSHLCFSFARLFTLRQMIWRSGCGCAYLRISWRLGLLALADFAVPPASFRSNHRGSSLFSPRVPLRACVCARVTTSGGSHAGVFIFPGW
jgi:hypothetical protein